MNTEELAINPAHNLASTNYILTLLSVAGVLAAITAVLIAWPALSYLGAKLM